ncbi:hypothetical protein N7516_000599 [Penicillium verrucosum]|uniref:uncharacterized protein n=1 Tax=Penicillium verrucosum TaxID=60171 RepID=UPI002545A6B5|nr:uncharacterized protein N7516_000599 [Penicillium verrucosum]KAJ5940431.1 hypothetical protein N7516_000599 [Penicillium verrucosum]
MSGASFVWSIARLTVWGMSTGGQMSGASFASRCGAGNEYQRANVWSIVCLEYRSPHGVGNEHRRANVWSIVRLTVQRKSTRGQIL